MCRRTEEEVCPTFELPCHRHCVAFFNVPVQAPPRGNPCYRLFLEAALLQSPFTTRMGIRRTYSRLKPPSPRIGGRVVINKLLS